MSCSYAVIIIGLDVIRMSCCRLLCYKERKTAVDASPYVSCLYVTV